MNLFVINFDETTPNQMFLVLLTSGKGDNLAECSWNNALGLLIFMRTHHRMGFSAACLPICEYCSIVTLQNIINKRERSLFVDVALKRVLAEHMVEGEWLGSILGPRFHEIDLVLSRVNIYNALAIFLFIFPYLALSIGDS